MNVIKFIPICPRWVFIPLLASLIMYAPIELTRIIYVVVWQHAKLDATGHSFGIFIFELAFIWISQILAWTLIYLRAAPKRKE